MTDKECSTCNILLQATEPETLIALAGLVAQHIPTQLGTQVIIISCSWSGYVKCSLFPIGAHRAGSCLLLLLQDRT